MKLWKYLDEHDLSANAFAEQIGVAHTAVQRYLAGRVPAPEIMQAIFRETKGEVQPNDFYRLGKS